MLYHCTLNIGRVMSPTLALIVQREAEIDTFKPVPFYTVALELPGLTVSGERMADKTAAEQLKEACQGAAVTIKKVERKEKSEKPPALYDLTTLQRDANRLLGFTAQQTLDYLQSLYEKKLCTYPRTDSRYLTGDMADSLPVLVNLVANAMPFRKGIAITCDSQTVINDKKVTDHHAVIPTRNLKDADLSALPAGEKAVLELVALRLLCAVAQPHIYSETVVIAACAGGEFTAKGKTVKHPGWKALEDAYRAKMKDAEPKKEGAEKALPELTEGQTLSVAAAIIKEGKSSPPQHFTEDTLLSAMETAGKEDMPEDAERKGLGTPATRAGILEKLVSAGFLERKKSRKTVQLLPSHDAVSLITVLPEQLQFAAFDCRVGRTGWARSSAGSLPRRSFWTGSAPCWETWWGLIRSSRELSTCSLRPVRWWANALAAAVKLQNCKKASSVRMILANLQSGKTTNGGLPRKNSRPKLWCLRC